MRECDDPHKTVKIELRRTGTPDDVADACVALVAARYATGQVLVVDGGVTLR